MVVRKPCRDANDSSCGCVAGHVAVEQYLASEGLPFTIFQPLYIYGPHTGKDCEQWFIDRVIRDRPVPIPAPGMQLVTLTHVEDVASMIAAVCAESHQARGCSTVSCRSIAQSQQISNCI